MWCISLGKKAFLRKGCRGRKARAPPPPTPHHQSGRSPSPRSRENSSGLYSSAFLIRTTPLNPPGEQREEEPVVNLKKAGPGSGNWREAGVAFGHCSPLASPAAAEALGPRNPAACTAEEPGRLPASTRLAPSADIHAQAYRGVSSTSRYLAPASGGGAVPLPRHFRVRGARCSERTVPPPARTRRRGRTGVLRP